MILCLKPVWSRVCWCLCLPSEMIRCLIRFCVLKETLSLAASWHCGRLDCIHEVCVKFALKDKGAAKAHPASSLELFLYMNVWSQTCDFKDTFPFRQNSRFPLLNLKKGTSPGPDELSFRGAVQNSKEWPASELEAHSCFEVLFQFWSMGLSTQTKFNVLAVFNDLY